MSEHERITGESERIHAPKSAYSKNTLSPPGKMCIRDRYIPGTEQPVPRALVSLFYRFNRRIEVNFDMRRTDIFPRNQSRFVVRLLLPLLGVLLTRQDRALVLHLEEAGQVLGAVGCGDRNQACLLYTSRCV